MKKKRRKINWLHLFIVILPVICFIMITVLVIAINTKPKTMLYAEIKPLSVVSIKEQPDNKEFTDKILNEMKSSEINTICTIRTEAGEQEEIQSNYLGTFLLTGYDDCYECQEEYVGTTALGVAPQPYHTIAVDTSIIPLGTHVLINGIEYVAEDVGGGVNGYHIDVFVSSHEETFSSYCNGYVKVYLVK